MSEKRAYVQTRDGDVISVPKSEVRARLESGEYLPATEADKIAADKAAAASTPGAQAKTFGESLAAGAIDAAEAPIALPVRAGAAALGAEDPFKNISGRATVENAATIFGDLKERFEGGAGRTGEAYGREYAENARARAEANPGATTAGNLAGSLLGGGALAGGARALGAKAASALGEGILARSAGAIAGGAFEGAAYGQAQAGEDAYIHNIPLTGEKLVASMGLGAILGGTVSLGSEALGGLLRRGSRGATPIDAPRLADGELGAIPEEAEAPIIGGSSDGSEGNSLANSLREFADERTAKALGARGSDLKKLGRTAEQAESEMHAMARELRGATLDDGTPVFQPLQSQEELAERVTQAKQEAGARLGAFREQADEVIAAHPEIAPKPNAIADRIEQEVVEPLASHPLSASRAQAAPIQQLVSDIRELSAPKFEAVPGASGRKIVQPKAGETPVSIADLTRLRQGLDEQIYQAKRGVNLTQQGAPPNLKDLERARMILEEHIEASSDKAAQYFDKAQAQSYKELKTQWRRLNIASDISGAAQLQNIGNRVVSPTDYAAGIAGAAAHGGFAGIASAAGHHVIREHASSVMAVLADRLANALDGKIDSGLGAFFKESTARAGSVGVGLSRVAAAVPIRRSATPAAVEAFVGRSQNLHAAYQKRVDEITAANRDFGSGVRGSMQSAMAAGYEAMPKLTQAATVTATRGTQYLESEIPGGVRAPTAIQPSRRTQPSDLEMRAFAQKWATVANPLSVVDDLRRGTVTHAQIDALKAVYPQMYAELQQKTLTKLRELDQAGKPIPFQDRLQLDLFLDLNGAGEPTLSGQFVDRIAALQAQQQQKQQQHAAHSNGAALQKLSAGKAPASSAVLGG